SEIRVQPSRLGAAEYLSVRGYLPCRVRDSKGEKAPSTGTRARRKYRGNFGRAFGARQGTGRARDSRLNGVPPTHAGYICDWPDGLGSAGRVPGASARRGVVHFLHSTGRFGPCPAQDKTGSIAGTTGHHLRQLARLAI